MNNKKTLREDVIDWWESLPTTKKKMLTALYFPSAKLSNWYTSHLPDIELVYKKEHPETIKDDDKKIEELEKDLYNQPTGTPPIKEQGNSVSISLEDAAETKDLDNICSSLGNIVKDNLKKENQLLKEQYNDLLASYGELLANYAELMRFHHVMTDAADKLQYPDNFLKAIEVSKEQIEKANDILKQFNHQ